MLTVRAIDPASPLYGQIRPGYQLLRINGEEVADNLDFRFKSAEERLDMVFADRQGNRLDYRFSDLYPGALGIVFEDDDIRRCRCNCVFCFVNQQPKGMRRALYVKDEDYRLSFTHGNFITLSNTTEEELRRIVEQRLSPLYVSVHATDDRLRRCLLRNEKLQPILPQLEYLCGNGITVHTQVVVCPGLNDRKALERTVSDLAALYPGVSSLAVVPVGLTRYRKNLPDLRLHSRAEARQVVMFVEKQQRRLMKICGSRFVWAADEFYLAAQKHLPSLASYEEMPQFENGVGMSRQFITDFNRRRRLLRRIQSKRPLLLLTGMSAGRFMTDEMGPFLRREAGLNVRIVQVANEFWGHTVSVSGLLTGRDLLAAARAHAHKEDTVLLPPNCLNHDDLFLDDLSLVDFTQKLNRQVVVGSYDLVDTIREAVS